MTSAFLIPALTVVWCGHSLVALAQEGSGARPPLQLAVLQQEARAADPRLRALQLQAAQTDLRSRNIEAERLPWLTAQGQTQYQSDVPTVPLTLPTGQPLFAPPKDTYDASLRVDQRLVDPSIRPRLELERAQLAESHARVRTTSFGLRQEVNEAFFTAALLQARAGSVGHHHGFGDTVARNERARSRGRRTRRRRRTCRSDAPAAPARHGRARRRPSCGARAAGRAHATRNRRRRRVGDSRS